MRLRTFFLLLTLVMSSAAASLAQVGKGGRLLFVGNSITLHGPSEKVGWTGNWGMAATAADKDYVHLVVDAVAKRSGGRPDFRVANVAEFERDYEKFDVAAKLKDELAFRPDTVIVAIGENVPPLKTDEAKTQFKQSVVRLLTLLRGDAHPALYVRSCFWANPAKDAILKEASAATGAVFVDISQLEKDEGNFARAEREIAHAGVGRHPGDKGMRAIGEAIVAAMGKASP